MGIRLLVYNYLMIIDHRDINDAIEARKKAEKMLFDDFLKWYDEEYKNNK